MIDLIKKNIFLILIFIIALSLGFVTFLTFIDKSFISLNDNNLQLLLICNVALLIIFLLIIFFEIKNALSKNINNSDISSHRKYIAFFAFFTLIPSLLISIFSLFLFSFAIEKYFDKKITTVVNNSNELAKNYLYEVRDKINSDIILISFDLNKSLNYLSSNPNAFNGFLNTQKIIRSVDEIHILDSDKNLLFSTLNDFSKYVKPEQKAFELVNTDARPLKIINAFENKSAALMKLSNNKYLYTVKFLDKKISKYLTESEEALNFYYRVENKRTGIKISFILIYIIIVTLLLFLSITIAIKFSSRFFISIGNLISASSLIGRGNLDVRVPDIESDRDLELLNKNFNLMINQLQAQQEKLLINERHEAWEHVARKLAHEIKNPLTPIQLTVDSLKNRYSKLIKEPDNDNFNKYLKIIGKQIKEIENLVNEFSDFARMPKPSIKKNNLIEIINNNVNLLSKLDDNININFKYDKSEIFLIIDYEQISRAFFNLIKNSIDSIQEMLLKAPNNKPKIDIAITLNNDYIKVIIEDDGIGFTKNNLKNIIKPYFTTKAKGSGLGLSIVTKIIYDHNGTIKFLPKNKGAIVEIALPNNVI
jgi:two-component system, NtrC family, nitrogen regulation sensor histidine kinase NtrY